MELNFKINVECKGYAAGTLGWLNEILSKTELTIKNNKFGETALFAKIKRDDDSYNYQFICKVKNLTDEEDHFSYDFTRVNNTDLKVIKIYESYDYVGFFGLKLTPAAEIKFEEFLNTACEKFVEWWENDSK